MARSLPYYPFYVDDFDEDSKVLQMNLSEVGLYILALNESWKRGSIPKDPTELAVLIRRKPADVKKSWGKVKECWVESSPGRLVNQRQEIERSSAMQKSEKAARSATIRHHGIDAVDDAFVYTNGHPNALLRAYESVSVSVSESNNSTYSGEIDFEDFYFRWCRHRGFKKPTKYLKMLMQQRWQSVRMTSEELDSALDGYFESEWGKKENYPPMGFLKNPNSWVIDDQPVAAPDETRERGEAEAATDAPMGQAAPAVAPQAAPRDYLADWNRLAPSAATEPDSGAKPRANLAVAKLDTEFTGRFEEICEIAEKIRKLDDTATWLTFWWAINTKPGSGRPNYRRLLTDMRGMAKAKSASRSGQSDDPMEAMRKTIEAAKAKMKGAK